MRGKKCRRLFSLILVASLLLSVVPDMSLLVEAADPLWAHLNEAEQNVGTVSYDSNTGKMTFKVDGGMSSRMIYKGLADVSDKDYAIEFDLVTEGGLVGVYTSDNSGAIYGVYLDTNAAVLDPIHYTDWTTCVDNFNFFEASTGAATVHPTVPAQNWNPATDKSGAHLRIEFIRGENGTLAGGTVNYFKRDAATGNNLLIGSISVPTTYKDSAIQPNHFGLQMWLGAGTISNITVTDFVPVDEPAQWVHMSASEEKDAKATYNKRQNVITFKSAGTMSNRMKYVGLEDTSGKNYAIEFDMSMTSKNTGFIGVYNYDESGSLYGVYLDTKNLALDALHYTDSDTCVDNFSTKEGKNPHPTVAVQNWVATDKQDAHLRVEFMRGEGGTLAGGTVSFYKQDKTTGEYLEIGTVTTPDTLTDDADKPNFFGIQMWLGAGTVSNMEVIELGATSGRNPMWTHMSDAEKNFGTVSYDGDSDTMTFMTDGSMASRMQYIGIPDVSGKDYAIEFDMTSLGGLIGVYNYESSGNMFGVYLDTNASVLDALHFSDWVTSQDHFNFYESSNGLATVHPTVMARNWDPNTDKSGAHLRVEFIRGEGGTLAGGTVKYYKQDSTTDEYLLIGRVSIPETFTDDANLENRFGIQMWLGSGTVENITVTEFTPAPEEEDTEALWIHMSATEEEAGTAVYDKENDKITFQIDPTFSARMKYTGIEDVSGKDYVIEFDVTAEGGLIGVYNYDDSGSMYGVYLDTNAAYLDAVHYTDWVTYVDSFNFFETTNELEAHPIVTTPAWDPSKDKASSHLRVEFLCGEGGTLAGGKVNYYKRDVYTGNYVLLGTVNTPSTVTDAANMPNYFGIQMWLGAGTVSNIKISEYTPVKVEKLPRWMHISDAEKKVGDASYNEKTDTITFKDCLGWTSRLINTEVGDLSGENFAVEFQADLGEKGAIGISPFYEDAVNFYNVYYDMAGFMIDGVGIMGTDSKGNLNVIDDFYSANDKLYPHFAPEKISPTKGEDVQFRIECFVGKGGTMAGGKCHLYFKRNGFDEWVRLGVMTLPNNIVDDPSTPNGLMIHGLLVNGSVSDIKIIRNISSTLLPYSVSDSKEWGYVSATEKMIRAASFNDKTGEMKIGFGTDWSSRMVNLAVPDVTGKAYALEFDIDADAGGAIGIAPFYENEDNWYGVYVDRGAQIIDGAGFSGGKIIDDFNYVDATMYKYEKASKTPVINQARYRFEFYPNIDGLATGGTCRIFFKQMPGGKILDDRWRLCGEFVLPDNVVDNSDVANKFMITSRMISATISNIIYTEIDPNTQTEYYNGPDEMVFEDGYPVDDYQDVMVDQGTIPWWSILLIVLGGGSLAGLLGWKIFVPLVKRKTQKTE